ncbi:hypothetical protein FA13DRAFT_185282 [Coprinellus micaceus]|uniref:Uncharacterized protein n=1 Tax=Coprinellus micaceus TaxID=71717 RepID=A0A4Y7TFX3_COPMI|nr:hypothetical protein FA13DRAFT_185282 [Coprinellus micaceus]
MASPGLRGRGDSVTRYVGRRFLGSGSRDRMGQSSRISMVLVWGDFGYREREDHHCDSSMCTTVHLDYIYSELGGVLRGTG